MPKEHQVPVSELTAAVQSAVQQVLGKQGAVPIDQLWVGFVAPENIASQANANAIAAALGREGRVKAQGSVAQVVESAPAAGGVQTEAAIRPPRIIGIILKPT
jgi:hypothetical protein